MMNSATVSFKKQSSSNSFPIKLFRLLNEINNKDSIDWLEHGNSFRVLDMNLFTTSTLPRFFKRKKFLFLIF